MKKQTKKRVLAAVCCAAVLLTGSAAHLLWTPKTNGKETAKTDILSESELKTAVLKKQDVPIGITYDEAVKAGHKARLYSEEPNIYTVVFQNEDNTRTMYYYNVPAKYEAADGTVRDCDNTIVKSEDRGFAYQNREGFFTSKYPKNAKDGISLSGENEITVKPVNSEAEESIETAAAPQGSLFTALQSGVLRLMTANNGSAEATEEYVDYPEAFGENTILRYTPLLNGVKQDVILNERVNKDSFSFEFDFGDSDLKDYGDGGLYVVDAKSNDETGYISPIRVFDANGKEAEGCRYTFEKATDGKWLVTAHVNKEYLESESTVYPVTVDPDYTDIATYGVHDATVYQSDKTKNEGKLGVVYAGKRSGMGVSRIMIGFRKLELTSIAGSEIYESYFSLRDLMCYSDPITLQAYEFKHDSWDESTVTWSNAKLDDTSSYASSPVATRTISYAEGIKQKYEHRYYFNIKSVVSKWCEHTGYPAFGFMVKSSSESTTRCGYFGSTQDSSNKPTLVLRYLKPAKTVNNGTFYFKNAQSGKYMTCRDSGDYDVFQKALGGKIEQRWKVQYVSEGCYYIIPEVNTAKHLKMETQENGATECNIRICTASTSAYQRFRIIHSKFGYRLVADRFPKQAVQITNGSTSDSTIKLTAYGKKNYQNWVMVDASKVPQSVTVSPTTKQLVKGAKATITATVKPSTASQTVEWKSSNTAVATVSSSGVVTAVGKGTAKITATSKGYTYATASSTVTVVEKPDLSVSALTLSGSIVGDTITANATIKNTNSAAAATSARFDFYKASTATGTPVYTSTVSVGALAVNGTKAITASFKPEQPGNYCVKVTADSTSAVAELNESNNTKTATRLLKDYYDAADGSTNTAPRPEFTEAAGTYGTVYTSNPDAHDRWIYSGDVDYFEIGFDDAVHTSVSVPSGCTVQLLSENGEVLKTSASGDSFVKCNRGAKYVKVTSSETKKYEISIKVFTKR